MTNRLADLRVMLSYARADAREFSRELADGLEAANFEVLLDVDDIEAAADWELRLADMIRSVDTLIVVLTPGWIASKICKWELDEAVRQNKRIIPLLHKEPLPDAPAPAEISRLNYIFFDGSQSFGTALKELAPALRLNLGWIRDHTHYSESARLWEQRHRDPAMLLRGAELKRAETWEQAREPNFPEVSMSLTEFLQISSEHETAQAASRQRTGSWTIAVFLIVPVCLAIINGYSVWLNFERLSAMPASDLRDFSTMVIWQGLLDNMAFSCLISAALLCCGAMWLRKNLSSRILVGTVGGIAAIGIVSLVAFDGVARQIVADANALDQRAASNSFNAELCAPTLRKLLDRYRDPEGKQKAPANIAECAPHAADGAVYNRWRSVVALYRYLPIFGLFMLPLIGVLLLRLARRSE